jgi:hypothetical protein
MCTIPAEIYSKTFCQFGGALIAGSKSAEPVVQTANW